MRKKATSDFQKSFFKLLNNATYGKTIESVRKRRNVVLTKEQNKFRKLVKSPLYHSFDNGMVAVESMCCIKSTCVHGAGCIRHK